MRKIAILSVNGTANVGGVERVVADHAAILSKTAHVQVFSIPSYRSIKELRKIRIIDLVAQFIFAFTSPLIARIWAGPNGILMTHGCSSAGFFCDIAIAHGCFAAFLGRINAKPGPLSRTRILYERLTALNARIVISVSENIEEQWIKHYGLSKSKSEVINNSVNTSIFYPEHESREPLTGDTIRIIFVGSCTYMKGFDYLARLHDEILQFHEKIELTICSPLIVPESIKQKYSLFRFLSQLDAQELRREYNRADLFLLPSRYEAFEMSSLESLSCGTPVMLNNTGARPTLEKMQCAGLYRLETEESPLHEIRQACEKLLGIKRKVLSDWTNDNFGISQAALKLYRICAELRNKTP